MSTAIETEISRFHSMTDAQFAAYSRQSEKNRERDNRRNKKKLEEKSRSILEARPVSRSVFPSKVLRLAAEAIQIAEEYDRQFGEENGPLSDEDLTRLATLLLVRAGIELDEFTP